MKKQRPTGIFPLSIHTLHVEELMKEYSQLTLPQRYEISALHKAGQGPSQIAAIVGVYRTTISRELKRNKSPNGYFAQAADRRAQQRRTQVRRPLKWTGRCRRLVEGKLHHPWSPEPIDRPAGWCIRHCGIVFDRIDLPLRRGIKARFPTGYRSRAVPPSSRRKLGSAIGKSIR